MLKEMSGKAFWRERETQSRSLIIPSFIPFSFIRDLHYLCQSPCISYLLPLSQCVWLFKMPLNPKRADRRIHQCAARPVWLIIYHLRWRSFQPCSPRGLTVLNQWILTTKHFFTRPKHFFSLPVDMWDAGFIPTAGEHEYSWGTSKFSVRHV